MNLHWFALTDQQSNRHVDAENHFNLKEKKNYEAHIMYIKNNAWLQPDS